MANSQAEAGPDSSEKNPSRFLQASEKVAAYFTNISPSIMSSAAQSFDVVTGATGATIEGDAEGASRRAAETLRTAIDNYQGPEEIRQIYKGLYDEPLTQIIGDSERPDHA